ncbi:MAG TPA: hypothetical protein VKF17_16255 [Isosphaeraceae bacterium]|nr:hypothetical protein [Isosphaeraceae bacterium]
MTGDSHDLFAKVDLGLLTRWDLESDRGQALSPFFLALGRDSSFQGSQLDVDPSTGQFLLNDDGIPLGNGTEEIVRFTERSAVETTRRGTFLKTDRGSGEITADRVAGDPQLSSNPFAPETLAGQFADSIHDLRFQHPGVLLRSSQVDTCYIRLVRLRVIQVDQIGVDLVHNPSLSGVQDGVTFSVVRGVSFGVA